MTIVSIKINDYWMQFSDRGAAHMSFPYIDPGQTVEVTVDTTEPERPIKPGLLRVGYGDQIIFKGVSHSELVKGVEMKIREADDPRAEAARWLTMTTNTVTAILRDLDAAEDAKAAGE